MYCRNLASPSLHIVVQYLNRLESRRHVALRHSTSMHSLMCICSMNCMIVYAFALCRRHMLVKSNITQNMFWSTSSTCNFRCLPICGGGDTTAAIGLALASGHFFCNLGLGGVAGAAVTGSTSGPSSASKACVCIQDAGNMQHKL